MPPRSRSDSQVLDAILTANAGRKRSLVRLKLREMASGVFPFFRGTNHLFAAEWQHTRPMQQGPDALICGDLHLENFGAYLTDDGHCRFAINDFDEAYIAPVGYDLVRCAASIFLAGEAWRLSTSTSAGMVVEFLDAYKQGVASNAVTGRVVSVDVEWIGGPVRDLLIPTAIATHAELIARVTRPSNPKGHRAIVLNSKRTVLGKGKRAEIDAAFQRLAERSPHHRSIEVLDATTRIAGLGSLGLRRYLVLVKGGTKDGRLRLLDVKEAAPSALRCCIKVTQPSWGPTEAYRPITAERLILGKPESGLATVEIGPRSCRVREMIPDANRSSLALLRGNTGKLRKAVRVAGKIAAGAHLRGIGVAGSAHIDELNAWTRGATFDAVMVAAARAAGRCRDDYEAYLRATRKRGVRKKFDPSPPKPGGRDLESPPLA